MTTPAERLWKQLEVPASVMGGTASILNRADVHHVLNENDRLRAAAAKAESILARNLGHQTEKCYDALAILQRALQET